MLLEIRGFLQNCPTELGEPVTHSHLSFPPRRGCCRRVFNTVTLMPGRHWQSFSSALCSIETRVFVGVLFFSHGVLESPLKAGLSQLLSCLWVFALSSTLQVFPDHSRQGWGRLLVLPPIPRSVFLFPNAQVGKTLSRLFAIYCCWIPQVP